jgi:hypothetical protein
MDQNYICKIHSLLQSLPRKISVFYHHFGISRTHNESEPFLSNVEKFALCCSKYVTIEILLSPTRIPLLLL